MRFTKIPLIATLMAVALSLLIVLPALAQVSGDRTDGRLSVGQYVDVRVADSVAGDLGGPTITGNALAIGTTAFNARDTYFRGDLYISNQTDAFNTILITARVPEGDNLVTVLPGRDGKLEDDGDGTNGVETADNITCYTGAPGGAAVATVRNSRSNTTVTVYLAPTDSEDGDTRVYQGIAAVWDQEDAIEAHHGPCTGDQTDPAEYVDDNPDMDDTNEPLDGWTTASAAVIPARDGDVITVSVKGVSGSIQLIVDGDAPEIDDTVPASGGVTNKGTVNLGFSVRDDGSGIRYDGESGASSDVDLQPHNGDGDQRFDEPITNVGPDHEPDATPPRIDYGDGDTMDISVNFTGDVHEDYHPGSPQVDEVTADPSADPPVIGVPEVPAVPVSPPGANQVGFFDDMDAVWGADTESSQYGSNDWTQRSKGIEYALDMRLVGNLFGTYYWQVSATDRVGNTATTDSDEDEKGAQPYSFNVDDEGPIADSARTGIGYEAGEGEFKDRSWIALNFVNEDQDTPDRIDASTVAASDFTVEGHTVMNAVVPGDKKVCKDDDDSTPDEDESAKNIGAYDATDDLGCNFEPRARIYLELADELASDETPTIQLLGGVFKDIAGNNNVTDSRSATDKIAPGISISISSSSGTTGRTATDDDGSFTVSVTSDEELSKFPRLFFGTIKATTLTKGVAVDNDDSDLTVALVSNEISMTEKETNSWEKKVDAEDLIGSGDRILAVMVTATDDPGNSGNSPGWKGTSPGVDTALDFKKLDAGGFLVEIDNRMVAADIEVLPSIDPGETFNETESMNPYIQITFSEPDEYGISTTGACTDKDDSDDGVDDNAADCAEKADIGGGDTARTDSHRAVTISALTLNGEDRLAEVVDVESWKYVLAVTGLAVGEYEIVYTANDDVGNEVEDEEFTFEVLKRQPYEIELDPGWNLISVPGDPFNPAVGSVIGADLKADTVLGYQRGEWVTAVRNEDGRWQGTLTDIQGGYGYWVRTTVVETIETVIPPTLPTSVLPTVPIVAGWNLVGVVDAAQRAIGEGIGEDADDYLTSLKNSWRVAYSFETQLNQWAKILPNDTTVEPVMLNGSGYWLWNTRAGTLVP